MGKSLKFSLLALLLVVSITLIGTGLFFFLKRPSDESSSEPIDTETALVSTEIVPFGTAEEFLAYLAEGDTLDDFGFTGQRSVIAEPEAINQSLDAPATTDSWLTEGSARVSETNVQVPGIDEPDIVKTDGMNIYYSGKQEWIYRGLFDSTYSAESAGSSDIYNPKSNETRVVTAVPPENLEVIQSLNKQGDLLLYEDDLIVIDTSELTGYDVGDPAEILETWNLFLDDKTSVISARLYNGSLYLLTANWIDRSAPCPIEPLSLNDGTEYNTIYCSDIYHPSTVVPVNATYTIFRIDPHTGTSQDSISFTGLNGQTAAYMSGDNIFLSYGVPGNFVEIYIDFLYSAEDLFPSSVREELLNLKNYDISFASKMVEVDVIMEEYTNSLSTDEELKIETEMINAWSDYGPDHIREFYQSGIVRISVDSLEFAASTIVPGSLLGQFSMDEYDGHLRVATTSEDMWGMGDIDSVNDVYVLDSDMQQVGSVLDLGVSESIYAVRFIGDAGYVVTFRQIDPFYVLDLSNPAAPELEGELKIPGYSSYLHPLGDDLILGVGENSGRVKLSLFDVTNPTSPVEKDTYQLDEYWSEISRTHHAFLQDSDNSIFFIPGGNAAYFFSYADGEITLEKAVGSILAKRAVYIDDYMYVVGSDKIIVLDMNTWGRENELTF